MIDRAAKHERREARHRKEWPIHGRSLQHILNAQRNRAERARKREVGRP